MNGRVSNVQTSRSHPAPAPLQASRLDAAASTAAGFPQSPREQSPVSRGLAQDELEHFTKRRLDTTSKTHTLPAAKRVRLEETEAQQPRVEDEEREKAAKTTLQQPKPKRPKRSCASFLEDCIDPVATAPLSESVTYVSEWLESVGSDRENRSRSDSHLHRSDDAPISRQLTRSAPEMAYTRDGDEFTVAQTPNSYVGSIMPSDFTGATGSGRSSGRSLVEGPFYRDLNLAANGIYMRDIDMEFPDDVAKLVRDVGKDRDSPGPSLDKVWNDADLRQLEMGAGESKVEDFFKASIFPKPAGSLDRSDRQPMVKHAVPSTSSKLKLSTPVPDMIYGYSRHGAFAHQQAQLISMGAETVSDDQGLMYPFLVIEFQGDGPTGVGSLWVATNQCLGGSTSCVNIAERLNDRLMKCNSDKIRLISSAAFSIAMSGTEARLYISWKHNDLDYYMRKVKSFLLQEPEYYLEFRKYIQNIMDWGKVRRLKEIRDSLDILQEESKRASEATVPPNRRV